MNRYSRHPIDCIDQGHTLIEREIAHVPTEQQEHLRERLEAICDTSGIETSQIVKVIDKKVAQLRSMYAELQALNSAQNEK